jgi:hypothetical protein
VEVLEGLADALLEVCRRDDLKVLLRRQPSAREFGRRATEPRD